jgi:CheY-like chemotaxis protein
MGGSITVNSQLGIGTRFQVKLPVRLTRPDSVRPDSSSRFQQVAGLAPDQPVYRILVVDDTDTNRQLMIKRLQIAGFEVCSAQNGQEAVEKWQQFQPDLVWMDIRMPVMDGFEALRQIRMQVDQTQPHVDGLESTKLTAPKIIAVTAAAFDEDRQRILAAGYDDFVPKPCSEAVMFDKLAQHLGVVYRYADSPNSTASPDLIAAGQKRTAALNAASFQIMPANWIAQLNLAARSADERSIAELLAEIPVAHSDLKLAIEQLLDNFHLEQLIQLTQPQEAAHDR